jgi:hypothetical protein
MRIRLFKILSVTSVFLGLSSGQAVAQCCSPGSPVGGTVNIGIVPKGTIRVIAFHRYSFSDTYFEGDDRVDFEYVKSANFNYTGLVLGYGLSKKLTVETELGGFINKSQQYSFNNAILRGYGLNTGVITAKYNWITLKSNPFEWTSALGAKIPFSRKYQEVNYVPLPRDIQPSTHAFGLVAQNFLNKGFPEIKMRVFLITRFESNFKDYYQFKFGNTFINSLFLSKQLGESPWMLLLQSRYEWRGHDYDNVTNNNCFSPEGRLRDASGGHLFYMAPQVSYTIAKKWNVSLLVDLPVYRHYNGIQLGNKLAAAVYLSRDFGTKYCEARQESAVAE